MLQVAYGGIVNITDSVSSENYETNLVYYEVGFNRLTPIVFSTSSADMVYILFRKRANDDGSIFEEIFTSDFEITLEDATSGEPVYYSLVDSSNSVYYEGWETSPSLYSPLALQVRSEISINNPVRKIRVINCLIRDKIDNSFISFRIKVNDDTGYFHYLQVQTNSIDTRAQYSSVGSDIYVPVNKSSDSYILFSPFNYLKEVNSTSLYDFSYPLNSVFYKRQSSYNEEEFDFAISNYSHSYLISTVSLVNVPDYHKAGVLLIDRYLYTELQNNDGESPYIIIASTGKQSGVTKNFKIRFVR